MSGRSGRALAARSTPFIVGITTHLSLAARRYTPGALSIGALLAQILLCAFLNLFDDWTLEEMPVKFVSAGMLCGIAFPGLISWYPALPCCWPFR